MIKTLLILCIFFIQFLNAKVLEINNQPIYNIDEYTTYALEDSNNSSPPEDKIKNLQWVDNKEELKKSTNSLAYWKKIVIKNSSNSNKTYYFKSENQFTYHIDFFSIKKDKITNHIEDGQISKNKHRKFNTNHIIFPMSIKTDETITVLFRIQNYNKIDLSFSLVNKAYLIDFYQTYNLIEGIFFGGILIMLHYNLFLYFLLHYKFYLYYVAYVFWLSIYFIAFFGFSQRYFENYSLIFQLSAGAFFIFSILFIKAVLNLKEKLSSINKVFNYFILYFIVATLLNIYFLKTENFSYAELLFNISFTLVPLLITIIITSTYYLAYMKNDKIAKFYSIIWTFIAIIGIPLPLEYLNIISLSIPSDYIFQFLILVEVLCFSFILAYKIKAIEQEKEEQEKILVQQNKLASMGEMISTIAHQWRQPLSEINGLVLSIDIDYKKEKLTQKTLTKYLDNVEQTTTYMSNTIDDFIDFFKPNKRPEKLLVSNIIETALNLLSRTNSSDIEIIYKKGEEVEFISHKSELLQALLILLNNAIDACLANLSKSSKIIIETRFNQEFLTITIIDNGIGIDDDIIEKIYNPYFTTKHQSQGTGLGLYILKMIMTQTIKGDIIINSSKCGTKCNILVPLIVIN